MFHAEAAFHRYCKKNGRRAAVELIADVNEYTKLTTSFSREEKKNQAPGLNWQRCLFDRNEHFIELSNFAEEDRSLIFMMMLLLLALPLVFLIFLVGLMVDGVFGWPFVSFSLMLLGISGIVFLYWPVVGGPSFFCALRARYRFNRSTRKVYVLRPARFGGNAVLDWDRAMAHVTWCAPREMVHDDLRDPVAREARQARAGGEFGMGGLLLYWPPFDREDLARTGEDVLWVGPKGAGENLWQYIRVFMEKGMDAVPEPNEFEWIRKGFHTMGEHVDEMILSPSRATDRREGRNTDSALTHTTFWVSGVWAPFHWLGERLCTWPTFPKEWNSDCGQLRRESGIGPEEPLRWTPRPAAEAPPRH